MAEHYYSKKPQTESKPKSWSSTLRGELYHFVTDTGVFSKSEVDFGSRILIDTFVMPVTDGPVLDVGCGYGPIGLSIAKNEINRTIHMVDINERAVQLAHKNAEGNGIQNVRIYESDGLSGVTETDFAAILTNPPIRAGKQTIFSFYSDAYSKLSVGGEFWVVIQKKQGAQSTFSRLEEIFGQVEVVEKVKGYWIIKSVKIKEY
ncbi:class I SAM-dependent methyltransferase [Paenisporosarcina sp. TG20]|uniref:class I SAM-dependent methyltransferase n=1 Tax=Paenisporosarcina sp. TG20 TaxID=1211706 RepID=UPI00030708A8|nr:class I SAM-dependent methyltransferase [Paenisporosarcina sp. TG20]